MFELWRLKFMIFLKIKLEENLKKSKKNKRRDRETERERIWMEGVHEFRWDGKAERWSYQFKDKGMQHAPPVLTC